MKRKQRNAFTKQDKQREGIGNGSLFLYPRITLHSKCNRAILSGVELNTIKKIEQMKKLILTAVCSVTWLVANQIAVGRDLIDPVMYLIALIGGGLSLVFSVGEIFVMKAEERLNEIEKENSKENIYTPKM